MIPFATSLRPVRPPHMAVRFASAAVLAVLGSGALGLWLGRPIHATAAMLLCGVALTVATGALARAVQSGAYPHERLGLCNLVTLARVALVCPLAIPILAGPLPEPAAWALAAMAAVALALDGLDGWLARRARLTSSFGARFDMEVDALTGALLALVALQTGKAGAWVLLLGLMRYGFITASLIWPWLSADLPFSQRRRVVCAVQIAALVALLAPPVAPPVSVAVAAPATLALLWSFAVDILWLWRHRR